MKLLAWLYRVFYVLVLILFGIRIFPSEVSWQAAWALLYPISCLVLSSAVALTILRPHFSVRFLWGSSLAWCLMFTWYAWFCTSSSPFIVHELHTLDPLQAALEVRRFYAISVTVYVLLLVWFLSFPLLQQLGHLARIDRRDGAP